MLKFLILTIQSMIEALYATHLHYVSKKFSSFWSELISIRRTFLTCQLVKQTIAFAKGQIAQVEAKKSSSKKIYNAIRLLMEAKRIAKGEEPKIWIEGDERDFIMEVRNEKYPLSELVQKCNKMVEEIDALKPWPIPDKVDEEILHNWLKKLRSFQFEQK